MTKKTIQCYLPLAAAIIFAGLGTRGMMAYQTYRATEVQNRALQQEIQLGESLENHSEAVKHYKKISPSTPQVRLKILNRQWLIALEHLSDIRAAQSNNILKKDVPGLLEHLKAHLDEMNEHCKSLLTYSESRSDNQASEHSDAPDPDADIIWRTYNLRGCVALLMAFIVSEWEGNLKKASGLIREAISDFKSAIEMADQSEAAAFEKHIPRWNLEILHGDRYMKKITFTRTHAEQRLKLRDNLEAIIPEKGGYAPGQPLERKIRK